MQPDPEGLLEVRETTSTMDLAREMVRSNRLDVRAVRADFQTAGRGRAGAPWISAPGESLLVTYILRLDDLAAANAGRLAIAAGVAAARAVIDGSGVDVRIKWPNDLLIDDRKLGGVLVEVLAGPRPVALIGVGINVTAPEYAGELDGQAVSLRMATGREWDVAALERQVRRQLMETLARPWSEQLAGWRALDGTTGRLYATVVGDARVVVTAEGIDDSGALRVRLPSGACTTVQVATGFVSPA